MIPMIPSSLLPARPDNLPGRCRFRRISVMGTSAFRRIGGVFLFLLWGQVATANALPCDISCMLERSVVHHHHEGLAENHAIGHHMSGSKISAPENCGTPQLMTVTFVPPDFPLPPSVEVAVSAVSHSTPFSSISAVKEFATPPP